MLSTAIKKLGDVDLVLTGRQAVDWDVGVTGTLIAEMLEAPVITFAKSVTVAGGKVTVERVLPDAFETVEAPLPAVVTRQQRARRATLPEAPANHGGSAQAGNEWGAADLGLDAGALAPRLTLEGLFVPVVDTKVEIMEGETPEEQAPRSPAGSRKRSSSSSPQRGLGTENSRMPNGVLILAEHADGAVSPMTAELVGAAQRLERRPGVGDAHRVGHRRTRFPDHRRREGLRRR